MINDTTCCGIPPSPGDGGSGNGEGYWYGPDGVRIPSGTEHNGVWYTSWLTGAVLLNYRGDGRSGETGLFRCDIKDRANTIHQLYICMYGDSRDDFKCKVHNCVLALSHALLST